MSEIDLHSMTHDQLLSRAATLFPTATALAYQGQHVTFAELHQAVDIVADHLAELGVRKKSKVGLLMTPSLQYIYTLLAVAKLGAAYLLLNTKMPFVDVERYLQVTEAEVFITDCPADNVELLSKIKGMLERLPTVQHLVFGNGPANGAVHSMDAWLAQGFRRPVLSQSSPDNPVIYCFTSGTTGGQPRVIVRSHSDMLYGTDFISRLELNEKSVTLSMVPLTEQVVLLVFALPSLVTGTAVVIPDFPGPDRLERFMQLIESEQVTLLHGSPTLFLQMTTSPAFGRYDLSSLKLAIATGAPITPHQLQTVSERLGCRVGRGYGMNEVGCIAMISTEDDTEAFLNTIGKPVQDREVKLLSEDENPRKDMPPGEVGEVVVRPAAIRRYFTFDVQTGQIQDIMPKFVDREGWAHSGDLGLIDARGNIQLVGRSKNIILRGGNTIYPDEIKEVIATHPQVQDAAVIGLPDPIYGEKIRACVILRDHIACSAREIQDYCRERLIAFKVPDEVRFCISFPLTETGKIRLAELRKREANIPIATEVELDTAPALDAQSALVRSV